MRNFSQALSPVQAQRFLAFAFCFMLPMSAEAQCYDFMLRSDTYQPPAGSGAAMAYDSSRGVTVFLGSAGVAGMQTWLWGGSSWLRCVPQNQPSSRVEHVMAFDSSRGVVVLFGGFANSDLSDTWEWDGANWAVRSMLGPSARRASGLAYDSTRQVVVLFGGTPSTGNPYGDTWEWNGQVWIQRSSTGPSPRYFHKMTYDAARSATVLFGGASPEGVMDDVWEWDGSQWEERSTEPRPPARSSACFAFDSQRRVSVLYGGDVVAGPNNVVWEWDGSAWHERLSNVNPGPNSSNSLMAYDSRRNRCVFVRYLPADTWEYPTASPVQIVANPVGRKVCLGESISLTVEAIGTGPFTYQWKKNGSVYNAPDATMQTVHINSADFGSAGEYEVVVSNGCSHETSSCATISVCPGPAGCPSPVDVNGDGSVNGLDVQRMIEVLLGG